MEGLNEAAFHMHVVSDGPRLRVALEGELDMANADSVRGLASIVPGAYDQVLFDLAQLTFIDSSGLNALVRVRNCGVPLVVQGASDAVRRVIDTVGLTDFLNVS